MSNYIEKRSLSADAAKKMIMAAEAKARETGIFISTTIVDEGGVLKAFSRMDNSPLICSDASRKKAVTAVGYGMPSGESWYNYIKDDPILFNGIQQFTDFILLGGGMPVFSEGSLIGAIGISGGHYKQDEACCQAALDAIA